MRNDNIMVDGIDFSDCISSMKRAFREKLESEIQRRRWNNNSKKLNVDIQLHMTIEKK